jgi:hypothetical protein
MAGPVRWAGIVAALHGLGIYRIRPALGIGTWLFQLAWATTDASKDESCGGWKVRREEVGIRLSFFSLSISLRLSAICTRQRTKLSSLFP